MLVGRRRASTRAPRIDRAARIRHAVAGRGYPHTQRASSPSICKFRPMSRLGAWLLGTLSRDPAGADLSGGTNTYTLDNALDFHRITIPEFVTGGLSGTVLDFGCGPGWQAVAMARGGAQRVVGVDINPTWIEQARALASRAGVSDRTEFILGSSELEPGCADTVLSSNSFEHFGDPEAMLREMTRLVRPGGAVWITFAEPWYSPYGSHMSFFTKLPWVNVLFSEATVLRVRSRYRSDGATRYEDVESGLNRMTLARFERVIGRSGLQVEMLRYRAARNLPLVASVPGLRELFVSAVSCRLRKPAS
jgi:ubiquinone/menaquinone biosynthesis C-methylase UbiE